MKNKIKLFIIPLVVVLSCSKNSDDSGNNVINQAPEIFSVSLENVTAKTATIVWTNANDPEKDDVVYDVFLDGARLGSNTKLLTFSFNNLLMETSYSVEIVASDGTNETSVSFSFVTPEFIPLVFRGDVELSNQQEVNEFGNNQYSAIDGNLLIGSLDNILTDVKDLSPLCGLLEVSGNLEVVYTSLETLEGLNNLKSVDGSLFIFLNDALLSLSSLESFINAGDLFISGSSLTSLKGLEQIDSVKNLSLSGNLALPNLAGLENISSVTGSLGISDNPLLENLSALNNIKGNVEYLGVIRNEALINLDGLSNITSVSINFEISGNSKLINLDELSSLGSIGLNENTIKDNPSLKNINGLNNVKKIQGNLYIYECDVLGNLDGLSNVTEISGFVSFYDNPSLENIEGLSSLEKVGFDLSIFRNRQLTNIDGLINLMRVGNALFIYGNESLTNLCGVQNLLQNDGLLGFFGIDGNAYEPTQQDIIDGNCEI